MFEDPLLQSYLAPLLIIVQLIFLEGILSIDNAAVLGAMVSILPENESVPYPPFFKFLQPFTDQVLGMQQQAALKVGLLGAYVGRGVMLVMASFVIANPWLRLLGALYLIKLAFENLAVSPESGEGSTGHGHHAVGVGFWLVVLNVELADLAFSIDNVVAAVALSDQLWVVLLGVALGIVTMRFAAGIFAYLIRRQPILEPAAYILVLAIGIELVLADVYHFHFNHLAKFMISIGILALCLLYARFQVLTLFDPLLRWLGEGMGYLNNLVNWLFKPLLLVLKLLFYPVRRLFATEPKPPHLHNPLEPADSSHTELAEG